MAALTNVSPGTFILTVAIAAGLAMAVFWHASKNGNKYATAWGIATFLFGGVPVIVYAILHSTRRRRY